LLQAALSNGRFYPKQYPAAKAGATACAASQISRPVEPEQVFGWRFSPAESSQISSRASQIAAALLFDLGTIDIRRVGTQSKRILAAGCSE
jgi:hypothetical protein